MNHEELAPGVTIGVVSATDDETGLGLVKVRFCQKGQEIESDWIQVMSFFGGPDRGAFFLPQKDDSALLAFADGDASKPYVLGFLWNGVLKPPVPQAGQASIGMFKTRSGKTITFDDSDADGKILINDQNGNQILLDTANNRVSIESTGDLEIKAAGKLTLSGVEVLVHTGAGVKLALTADSMAIAGSASLKLSAGMIDLN